MREQCLSYDLLFLLLIQSFVSISSCNKIKYHLSPSSSASALEKNTAIVLSFLVNSSDKEVCVWSVQVRGSWQVENLITGFMTSYKIVASFYNDQVDFVPIFCRLNVLLTDSSSCAELLVSSIPLTVNHRFYILVNSVSADELDSCSAQFGVARVAFVSLLDANVFALSSPLFPQRRFVQSNLTCVFKIESLYQVNLKGRPVAVALFNCPPFVIIQDENDSVAIRGIEWEVLKYMARIMNFSIKLVELKGEDEWSRFVTGSWKGGVIQAIREGVAEVGMCNMWYNLETSAIMDFGPPISTIKFTFIVPRPKRLHHHWKAFVQIFDRNVWILLFVFYVLNTMCYWKFVNKGSNSRSPPGLAESYLTMFGVLMGAYWPTHGGRRGGARLLFTLWCIFVLLLTSFYNTRTASGFTLHLYEQRLDTVEQLVQQDFRWTDSPDLHNTSMYFNFQSEWQRLWEQRYVPVSSSYMKDALDSGKFAFPIQKWGRKLLFFKVDGLDVNHDLRGMRVLKETTATTYVSIKFAKNWPLYKASQVALSRVFAAGLVSYWEAVASRARVNLYARKLLQEQEGFLEVRRLAIHNLGAAFIMLGAGLFTGLIIFIVECFAKVCKGEPDFVLVR